MIPLFMNLFLLACSCLIAPGVGVEIDEKLRRAMMQMQINW